MNIKQLRKQKGISQNKLAKLLGVTQKTVSTWETGQRVPTIGNASKMAKLFGVTIDYLMGG